MAEDTEGMKASIVFMCSLHQNPLVEIESVTSVKVRGMFMPALGCTGIVEKGHTYPVKFPIAALEALNESQLEEMRKHLHERIDKSFDEYKKSWAMRKEQQKEAPQKSAARHLSSLKNKEESDAPTPEPNEDVVREEGNS